MFSDNVSGLDGRLRQAYFDTHGCTVNGEHILDDCLIMSAWHNIGRGDHPWSDDLSSPGVSA